MWLARVKVYYPVHSSILSDEEPRRMLVRQARDEAVRRFISKYGRHEPYRVVFHYDRYKNEDYVLLHVKCEGEGIQQHRVIVAHDGKVVGEAWVSDVDKKYVANIYDKAAE